MSQFSLLAKRRFAPFFWTQALGAFNDNAFRNAMVMLVAFQMALPDAQVSLYTNLAPALFILPYFLFSATAGQLAEKFEKTRIIRFVKLFEIAAMAIAAIGFFTHHVSLLLVVLFLMGVHSTVFGPIKYSILPQALERSELVGGNALVETGTQLAMLTGMILGNSLMLIAGYGTLAASLTTIAIACAGYVVSRSIPIAPATAPDLRFNWNPFSETWRVLKITHEDRAVFNAVLGISWFWFFGTVMIAQLPNYTRHTLGGDGSVNTLVLTLFSLGTGIGSLLCEKLSAKRVEIGLVPDGRIRPYRVRGGPVLRAAVGRAGRRPGLARLRRYAGRMAGDARPDDDRRVRRILRGAVVRLRAEPGAARAPVAHHRGEQYRQRLADLCGVRLRHRLDCPRGWTSPPSS